MILESKEEQELLNQNRHVPREVPSSPNSPCKLRIQPASRSGHPCCLMLCNKPTSRRPSSPKETVLSFLSHVFLFANPAPSAASSPVLAGQHRHHCTAVKPKAALQRDGNKGLRWGSSLPEVNFLSRGGRAGSCGLSFSRALGKSRKGLFLLSQQQSRVIRSNSAMWGNRAVPRPEERVGRGEARTSRSRGTSKTTDQPAAQPTTPGNLRGQKGHQGDELDGWHPWSCHGWMLSHTAPMEP